LRAFLWNRRKNLISATKSASRVGVGFGYGLMAFGLFQIFTSGLINGIWLMIMGSFLRSTARQSYVQTINEVTLSNIGVKEILSKPKRNLEIPFEILISEAIREYFIPYQKSYFPVIQGDQIVGIVHIKDIKKIPIHQRSEYIVGYIMRKISEFPSINDDQTGKEVLKKFKRSGDVPNIIIVQEKNNKQLLGFISEDELRSSLKYWSLYINQS
ncbi:MAG: CBS domain-containing protein, partial [Candidatus Thorarchaeota archaeon]